MPHYLATGGGMACSVGELAAVLAVLAPVLSSRSDENGSDTNGYTSIRIQIVIFSRTRIRTQIVPDTDTNTDRAQIVSTYGCGSNT
jgi:hypothetical protein